MVHNNFIQSLFLSGTQVLTVSSHILLIFPSFFEQDFFSFYIPYILFSQNFISFVFSYFFFHRISSERQWRASISSIRKVPTATWTCIQESVTFTQLSDTCSPIWTPRSGAVLGEVGAWTRSQSSALQVKMQILLDWPSLRKMCQGKEKNSLVEILTSSLAILSSFFSCHLGDSDD